MRNFVLIHLESLNYMNYRLNRELFPNLLDIEKKSLSFKNYFSTATSTWMVIGDLMYGGLLQYEVCDSLDCMPKKYCCMESLFDTLKTQGYETNILSYETGGGDFESANRRNILGFHNKMKLVQGYEDYISEVNQAMKKEQPFALMVCNFTSNVSFNHYIPHGRFESGLERWKNGYKYMDTHVGDIMKLLENKNLMDSTTIILYGDHGDDYLEHGYHEGLFHAIEPYANLVHTPLFIYDSRLVKTEECTDLINTTDIRTISEALLKNLGEKFCWKDLGIPLRKYTLARNAYAAQPVRKGTFNKGYCITEGKFLIMVSNNGLEMYDIEMDLQCQNNLLKFFAYKNGILQLDKELNDSLSYHYKDFINMSAIRQIRQTFYFFRKKLFDEIMEIYHYAECEDRIEDLNFEEINYS